MRLLYFGSFISFVGFDEAEPVYLCLHEKQIGLNCLVNPVSDVFHCD